MNKTQVTGVAIVLIVATGIFFMGCTHTSTRASIERGEKVYTNHCLSCHQVDGSGVPGLTPPLKNTSYVLGADSRLIGIVLNGLNEDLKINGDTFTNPMPPFKTVLKDEEVADVLTYIRNSFGNKASAVSASQVKEARE